MKYLFVVLFLAFMPGVQAQPPADKAKADSLHRADSIRQWKADSVRAALASPLRVNPSSAKPIPVLAPTPGERRLRSNYTTDRDGRVTGGNTSVEIRKSRRRGN